MSNYQSERIVSVKNGITIIKDNDHHRDSMRYSACGRDKHRINCVGFGETIEIAINDLKSEILKEEQYFDYLKKKNAL